MCHKYALIQQLQGICEAGFYIRTAKDTDNILVSVNIKGRKQAAAGGGKNAGRDDDGDGEVDLGFSSPRNIIEIALNAFAGKIVLVHNHPSGGCVPSKSDVSATRDLQAVLTPLNIVLADHLVVTASEYFSFSMHGLLPDIWSEEKEQ